MVRRFKSLHFLLILLLTGISPAVLSGGTADFSLPDLHGKQHALSDYRGKWVLVNYWATWCPPCRKELPELELFHTQSEGKAVVLGVNTEAIDREELGNFLEEQFLSFPVLMAGPRPGPDQRLGKLSGLPTSFLVAPDGRVVARQVGPITADAIRRFIHNFETRDGEG